VNSLHELNRGRTRGKKKRKGWARGGSRGNNSCRGERLTKIARCTAGRLKGERSRAERFRSRSTPRRVLRDLPSFRQTQQRLKGGTAVPISEERVDRRHYLQRLTENVSYCPGRTKRGGVQVKEKKRTLNGPPSW